MRFGKASADFLFRLMVTSIPLSKESGGNEEGSATGSEGREGVGFTERGEEGRLEAAERESERRAGIQCHGGSGTDRTDFMRPSVLRTGESGEESKGESLWSDRTASGGEEVSSTGTSAAEGVSENRGEAGSR